MPREQKVEISSDMASHRATCTVCKNLIEIKAVAGDQQVRRGSNASQFPPLPPDEWIDEWTRQRIQKNGTQVHLGPGQHIAMSAQYIYGQQGRAQPVSTQSQYIEWQLEPHHDTSEGSNSKGKAREYDTVHSKKLNDSPSRSIRPRRVYSAQDLNIVIPRPIRIIPIAQFEAEAQLACMEDRAFRERG